MALFQPDEAPGPHPEASADDDVVIAAGLRTSRTEHGKAISTAARLDLVAWLAVLWVADGMLAFPALVFALAVVSFAGATLTTVVLTIAILGIPGFARVGRALTLSHSQRPFVMASQAMGARKSRTMVREVLPNVIVP